MNKNSVFYTKIKTVNTSCLGKTMNFKKVMYGTSNYMLN
jgi:hypothetical protein